MAAGRGFQAQGLDPAPGPEEGSPDDEFRPFIAALAAEWERSDNPEDRAFGSLLRQFTGRVGLLSVRGAPAALDIPTADDGTYLLEGAILRLNPEEVERFRAFGQATSSTELGELIPKFWVRKELGGYRHLKRYPDLERSTRWLRRMWDDEVQRSDLREARVDEAARNPRLAAIARRLTAIWAGGEGSGYQAALDYLVAQGVRPARVLENPRRGLPLGRSARRGGAAGTRG